MDEELVEIELDETEEATEATGEGSEAEEAIEEHQEMDAEERHRQAAARRQREDAARAAAQQMEIDNAYAAAFAGKKDPYHGNEIRTKADYDAYQQALEEDRQKLDLSELEESGINPDLIGRMVREAIGATPELQQINEVLRQTQEREAAVREQEAQESINRDLTEIGKIDPRIKSAEDIMELYPEAWDDILADCQNGAPLLKAFKGNTDTMAISRKAGAQIVRNNQASKAHLRALGKAGRGGTTVSMPREVLEQFRAINPGKSDAEYAAYWRKHHKEE